MASNTKVLWSSGQGGSAFLSTSGANGYVNVIGNSTVNSDFGNPANNDFITGATIAGVWWCTTGTISILRGANVVLTLTGAGHFARDSGWPGINLYSGAANIVFNVPDANSSVMCIISKEYVGGSPGETS
jgi:hypothetical protein